MKQRRIWNIAIVTVALATGIALSIRPWDAYFKQRALSDAQIQQMQSAERDRADLSRQKARVENPTGMEALARQQGFHKPGEIPVDPD